MCCSCGNLCCGSDQFGGCGCDHCEDPDCWSDDVDELDVRDLPRPSPQGAFEPLPLAALRRAPSRFRCVEIA